jgi:hypothetical protein
MLTCLQTCINGTKLTASRDAKRQQLRRLAKKKRNGTLTKEQQDLQGALAVELEALKKQLAHFKLHKKQMKNQRAYIRKCEKELEPRGRDIHVWSVFTI